MIIHPAGIFHHRGEAPLSAARESGQIQPAQSAQSGESQAQEELSFWDLLDVVNPLQHLPVVSSVYRHLSGDEIGGLARLAGGFLFGGPLGLATSAANLGIEGATGKDLGSHIMSALSSEAEGVADSDAAQDIAQAVGAYDRAAGVRLASNPGDAGFVIDVPA